MPGPDDTASGLSDLPLQLTADGAGWLLEQLPQGVLVQDGQGRPTGLNRAGQRLLGFGLEQLQAWPPAGLRLSGPDGRPLSGPEFPSMVALRERRPVQNMVVALEQQGERRWLRMNAVPQQVAGSVEMGVVFTLFEDITEWYQTQQRLVESEERYRSLVEATEQYVWTNTPDGHLVGEQPGWSALTGMTEVEYQGHGWLAAIHPDDRERTEQAWAQAVAGLRIYNVEHRVRTRSGEYRTFHARAVPRLDQHGQLREWIGLHTDISGLKAAQDQLRQLNSELEGRVEERTRALSELSRFNTLLLAAAGEGVFGLNPDGSTRFANPAAAAMLGYTVQELEGVNMHQQVHQRYPDGQPYPPEQCPVHQVLRDGQTRRMTGEVFWRKDGSAVPVEYVTTALRDEAGEVVGAVVLFQDVTEALEAQAALQTAIQELRRSNQELEQFAYVASHDLQEPLRTLGSYAELLGRRYQGQLDPRADQYLVYMQDAVGRMRQLITDLLTFSRVGRTDTPHRAVALDEVMETVAASLALTLQERSAQLVWEDLPMVDGIGSQMVQLMTNLVSNALKFGREGVPPVVRVTARREGDRAHLQVQDNGIGMEAEYHDRVFGLFQRLHRRDQYEGTGLGLAICRKIVEMHGGRIWLESEVGVGTTVHFTLPLAGEPHDEAAVAT
ncbi:PAS domain S-box protein [Deinococcus sonorensis]|uniref:histidine kinase n=2 Tax=Deinococcus sonorensis TaxID=309891 RepID=A0AAU7UDH4_9DEIO